MAPPSTSPSACGTTGSSCATRAASYPPPAASATSCDVNTATGGDTSPEATAAFDSTSSTAPAPGDPGAPPAEGQWARADTAMASALNPRRG